MERRGLKCSMVGVLLGLSASLAVAQPKVWICADEDGTKSYSDRGCPLGTTIISGPRQPQTSSSAPTPSPQQSRAQSRSAPFNPICPYPRERIVADIKQEAARKHPDDPRVQVYVINKDTAAMTEVCSATLPPQLMVAAQKAWESHYPSYSVIKYVIERQGKALKELSR